MDNARPFQDQAQALDERPLAVAEGREPQGVREGEPGIAQNRVGQLEALGIESEPGGESWVGTPVRGKA